MQWDPNGNMTYFNSSATGETRRMCWDEENRLAIVKDPNYASHYVYDAGGERVWKITGPIERMSINGGLYVDQTMLDYKTLYASPYMVISDMEYTKHFYAESQRVTTKLGGGFSPGLVDPQTATLSPIVGNIQDISDNLWNYIYENTNCVAGEPDYVSINPSLPIVDELISSDNDETDLYFYHPDHLGSSSFISDVNGDVNQHLQYLPFGESFIDQQTNHNIRFTFSSKEKDSETGFGYFGARYYNADISVWLSVDPLADQYPSTSPYMYVLGQPIALIDPNGMNAWIPPTEDGGAWTAESGDSPWSLYDQAGLGSVDEAKDLIRANNKKNNNNRSSETMVYEGDKINIPGSSSGYIWNSGSSTTNSSANTTPSTASTPSNTSGSSGNPVKTTSKVNIAAGIVIPATEQTMQNTRIGANFAYAISGNTKVVNAVSNTFKYAPYAGLGVTVLSGAYLSTQIEPATNRPYQSWLETGTDIGASIGSIAIGAKCGGWWGAGAATLYVADKAAFKAFIKTSIEHPERVEAIHWGR